MMRTLEFMPGPRRRAGASARKWGNEILVKGGLGSVENDLALHVGVQRATDAARRGQELYNDGVVAVCTCVRLMVAEVD